MAQTVYEALTAAGFFRRGCIGIDEQKTERKMTAKRPIPAPPGRAATAWPSGPAPCRAAAGAAGSAGEGVVMGRRNPESNQDAMGGAASCAGSRPIRGPRGA